MSSAPHFLCNNIPGFGPSDKACLSSLSRAVAVAPCLLQRKPVHAKTVLLRCPSKQVSIVCKAGSNGHRRNPDFSRQNRHGFSRNRNKHSEERDSSDNYEDSECLSSKNGPVLSLSNNPKFQATSAPGPREREIVELFRRVQAQLRERAAAKEDKKVEASKGQSKESETVDSLLKLLRKHSVEQGKRKVNGGSGGTTEFDFDQPGGRNTSYDEDKNISFFHSDNIVKDEFQATSTPSSRPVSKFRRRSPVPRVRYEPVVSPKEPGSTTVSLPDINEKIEQAQLLSEAEPDTEPENDLEHGTLLESEPMLEPEASFVDDPESSEQLEVVSAEEVDEEDIDADDDREKQSTNVQDLNAMKLPELRALAKARGVKGYSKLKKSELIGLLSEDSI